uniref:Uncharacterized protein n=1 Tax=mine drainage metagenome TaxID=410659 RepID=E6PED1_9ZZZZ
MRENPRPSRLGFLELSLARMRAAVFILKGGDVKPWTMGLVEANLATDSR